MLVGLKEDGIYWQNASRMAQDRATWRDLILLKAYLCLTRVHENESDFYEPVYVLFRATRLRKVKTDRRVKIPSRFQYSSTTFCFINR